jgi:hypothetical protein
MDRCARNSLNNHEIHEIFAKMCIDLVGIYHLILVNYFVELFFC